MSSPISRDVMNSSPDSDKENSNPGPSNDLTTLFFPRAYKTPPQPPAFKRRLIDVGDATVDDISLLADFSAEDEEQQEDEDDENATLTFREMAISCSPKSPEQRDAALYAERMLRTPFAELILEDDVTPVPKGKTYLRHFSPAAPFPAFPAFTTPQGEDAQGHSQTTISSPPGLDMDGSEAPEIRISPAEDLVSPLCSLKLETIHEDVNSQASSSLNLEDPVDFSSSGLTSYRGHLRPARTNAGAHANRCSADLYSSFFAQMQSSDSSFDLLNDKISFLSQESGMESMLEAMEEESFDLQIETAKMANTLREVVADSAPTSLGKSLDQDNGSDFVTSYIEQSRPVFAERQTAIHEIAVPEEGDLISISPTTPAPSTHSRTVVQKRLSSATPQSGRDGPALAPPPPVPALRIVKRQNLPTQASRPVGRETARAEPAQSSMKPASRRPSNAMAEATKRPARIVTPPTSASGSSANAATGSGPRRVLVTEDDKPIVAMSDIRTRPSSRVASSNAPKRLPIPGNPEPAPIPKLASASGLKPPTRYGSTMSAGSSLPRPVTFTKPTATAQAPETGKSKFTSLLGRGISARR
ncbi:hypothetical protein BDN72DRAFT_891040 [Pluteus cervinus]|uniref:Uncharacterized protein n=1 Tax=Pluteus cervinus TaxID=181527 RepID=A0ACD3BHB7_9AGAR|nr:hypothetical protein BDN72DRAFT_891040 [Pluteus cervinus]